MLYELPTQQALAAILAGRLGYTPKEARMTAADLLSMTDRDLRVALASWVENPAQERRVQERGTNTEELMALGLTYPAALVMIDWLRTSPEDALSALKQRM